MPLRLKGIDPSPLNAGGMVIFFYKNVQTFVLNKQKGDKHINLAFFDKKKYE